MQLRNMLRWAVTMLASVFRADLGSRVWASMTLFLIIAGFVLAWPTGDAGHYVVYTRAQTGELHQVVQSVVPDSSAATAGLRVGDHIVQIDGQPIAAVLKRVERVLFDASLTHPNTVTVLRAGRMFDLSLAPAIPTPSDQYYKLALTLLAIACWFTGYYLAVVRRQHVVGSHLVAIFWMNIGAIIGFWTLAQDHLVPIFLLTWVLTLNLIPLLGYIHRWYPPRLVTAARIDQSDRRFLLGLVVVNLSASAGLVTLDVPFVYIIDGLLLAFPVGLLVALIISALYLFHAYRNTQRAHVRRQIRLILSAFLVVILCRVLVRAVPPFSGVASFLDGLWLDLLFITIPLAYLVGGGWPDLYQVDRIVLQVLSHLLIVTVLVVGLNWVVMVVDQYNVVGGLYASIGFVVLYRPMQSLLRQFTPGWRARRAREHALENTLTNLTRTLDGTILADTFVDGVQQAVSSSVFAYYHWDPENPAILRLHTHTRINDIPSVLGQVGLKTLLTGQGQVIAAQQLVDRLVQLSPLPDAADTLLNPQIVLCCSILHQDELLGLLLLGQRDDFDAYRTEDLTALRRLITAAALAFANSSTHRQQQLAEALIRQLYRRLQAAQDDAARDLARELHDEVINGPIRLNIDALRDLLARVTDPRLRYDLERIAEGEQTVLGTLRQICEQLYPTGMDDPLGLAAVVRAPILQHQAQWSGGCTLEVSGTVQPVPAHIQHEVLRITREALTNIVKHAQATAVTVSLQYQEASRRQVRITIQDNGRIGQMITPRAGHLGVRAMQEGAQAVGGTLSFCTLPTGGSNVELTIPLEEPAPDIDYPASSATPHRDPERVWRGPISGPSLERLGLP